MKKVLIIGSGGREYSIGYALKNEAEIFYAPGNGATTEFATNLDIKDYYELRKFAIENDINLTIVGPEAPLVDGVVDIFKEKNLTIFGASKDAARLEGSKVYMKNFLKKYNIPTAKYIETDSKNDAYNFIDEMQKTPIVIKADGLCAGKGVIIATSKEEAKKTVDKMLSGEAFGEAGKKVIVEEYLDGYELSMFAICDGKDFVLLPAAQDHKRVGDGDTGPNTGGMGAYAPTPLVNDELYEKVKTRIIRPTLKGMQRENAPYEGVLFIGIMVVDNEPIVLEYNVRFGDPECEELMPLIDSSVYDMFYYGAKGELDKIDVKIKDIVAVGVVCASKNYPYSSSEPALITVDEENLSKLNGYISYAGVSKKDDRLIATGGRVLVCVGKGKNVKEARDEAYKIVECVHFDGMKYRKDIAYQAI
jgi:phosphoribosylamine--glycine ligase